MERYDIAIIGTGPAGVSAAITAKVRGKRLILFGAKAMSDKVEKAHSILNYPGLPNVTGAQLAQAFSNHLESMDIPITEKQVTAVYAMGDYFAIQTPEEMIESRTVILAAGVVTAKALPGENEFLGRGVSYLLPPAMPTSTAEKPWLCWAIRRRAAGKRIFWQRPARRYSTSRLFPMKSRLARVWRSSGKSPPPFWATVRPAFWKRILRSSMLWMGSSFCVPPWPRKNWCRESLWRKTMSGWTCKCAPIFRAASPAAM